MISMTTTLFVLCALFTTSSLGQTKTCYQCENGQCDSKLIPFTSPIFSIDTEKYVRFNYAVSTEDNSKISMKTEQYGTNNSYQLYSFDATTQCLTGSGQVKNGIIIKIECENFFSSCPIVYDIDYSLHDCVYDSDCIGDMLNEMGV